MGFNFWFFALPFGNLQNITMQFRTKAELRVQQFASCAIYKVPWLSKYQTTLLNSSTLPVISFLHLVLKQYIHLHVISLLVSTPQLLHADSTVEESIDFPLSLYKALVASETLSVLSSSLSPLVKALWMSDSDAFEGKVNDHHFLGRILEQQHVI